MELWARNLSGNLPKFRLPRKFRDLLRAVNLRHGTDGFTSPPKEGVLKIFLPLKIRLLRPGLNPRTWVLKASTLPLDHRSRYPPVIAALNIWVRAVEENEFSYLLYLQRPFSLIGYVPRYERSATVAHSVGRHS